MQEVVSIQKWDTDDIWEENNSIDYYDENDEKNQIFLLLS